VNRLGTIVDVDDARMASEAPSRSSSAITVRLASSVSGEFSWTKLAPANASDRLVAARTRAAATLASFTKPYADSSCSKVPAAADSCRTSVSVQMCLTL
jgi:hypothetical protein